MSEKFYGKYRGIVFDNKDDKKLLRIKAIVPIISDKPLNWAFPCVDFLGADKGSIKIPSKDDGVWIEFEGGEVNKPIWVGMWAAKNDIPADFEYSEKSSFWKDDNGNVVNIKENEIDIEFIAKMLVKMKKLLDIQSDDDITVEANKINLNDGDKGAARLDDEVKSTSAEDSSFWAFWTAFFGVVTGAPIPEPGNGSPSAFQTALSAAITAAGGTPSSLTGKITASSDSVKVGD